jgi:hypothetical protein
MLKKRDQVYKSLKNRGTLLGAPLIMPVLLGDGWKNLTQ